MKRLKFYFFRSLKDLREANIADWFSIYRIGTAPIIVVLIFLNQRQLVSWLLLTSFLTDLIDGQIARRFNLKTQRGANLDSRGDAMTFLAAATGVIYYEWNYFADNWLLWSTPLFLYLLQLIISLMKYGKPTSFHTYSAKIAAGVQATFLLVTLFFRPYDILLYLAIGISILETLEELILVFIFRNWKSDVKGLYWVLRNKDL